MFESLLGIIPEHSKFLFECELVLKFTQFNRPGSTPGIDKYNLKRGFYA